MQEITVTPLEALAQLAAVASQIDTAECKDEGIYNRLQGAVQVAQAALAMAPKQEAQNGYAQKNPQAHTWPAEIYLQAGDTDVEAHLSYDTAMRHEVTWAAESIDWNDVRYIRADLAAPAATNGALPEPVTYMLRHPGCFTGLTESGYNVAMHKLLNMPTGSALVNLYTEDQVRAILAAAGPDAALIEAARNVVTCFNDPHTSLAYVQRWVNELAEVLALSGAKGN